MKRKEAVLGNELQAEGPEEGEALPGTEIQENRMTTRAVLGTEL